MSKEYNGWKLFDKIIIVKTSRDHYKYGYKQGYIVEPNNKKQLESAKNWGGQTIYDKDEDGNYIVDENGNYSKHYIGAEVIETDNIGFKLTLLDCAGGSSQGGKLSFWNCLIEKDNDKYVVGINSELLLELMLQSTFTNGVCDKKLCFARKNGNVGVLHEEMSQYKDAINDMHIKKDVNTKKTSKWQIGNNYVTLQMDDIYFGKLFQPIVYEHHFKEIRDLEPLVREALIRLNPQVDKNGWYHASHYIYLEEFNIDKTRSRHLTIDRYYVKKALGDKEISSATIKDYIKACRRIMNNDYLSWRKITGRGCLNINSSIVYSKQNMLDKIPSRKQGDINLGVYDDYYADVEGLLHYQKTNILKLLTDKGEDVGAYYSILSEVIKSTDGSMSELDFEVIGKIFESHLDDNNHYTLYKIINNGTEEYLYTKQEAADRIKELLQ